MAQDQTDHKVSFRLREMSFPVLNVLDLNALKLGVVVFDCE